MRFHLIRLSLLLCLIAPLSAQSKQIIVDISKEQPSILVTGQGLVFVTPDIAYLTLSIITRNKSIKKARTKATTIVDRTLNVIKQFDIDLESVNTSFSNIQPEYFFKENRNVFSGYKVSRTITIELRSLSKLGGVIEGLLDSGINQLSPPKFGSTQKETLTNEALALATKNATARAKIIADNLNVKLNKPIEVVALNQNIIRPEPFQASRAQHLSTKENYLSGQIKFSAQVQVRFSLK